MAKTMETPKKKTTSKALAKTTSKEDREKLNLLMQKMAQRGFEAVENVAGAQEVEEQGLVDKEDLIGVPFAIMHVDWRDGDFGTYASVHALLKTGELVVFNDGSTGVMQQLEGIEITPETPLIVRGGLRASHYDGPNGKPATTYYLSGRKAKTDIAGINKGGAAARNGARDSV